MFSILLYRTPFGKKRENGLVARRKFRAEYRQAKGLTYIRFPVSAFLLLLPNPIQAVFGPQHNRTV